MKLQTAQLLARQLMNKHMLYGWHFEFDNSRRRFGVCNYTEKRIGLSKALTQMNRKAQVKDTILHEIAHALVGPGHGHNKTWKAMCRKIGAIPKRCYSTDKVKSPQARYIGECPSCKKTFTRDRLSREYSTIQYSCRCQTGKPWAERTKFKYVDTKNKVYA